MSDIRERVKRILVEHLAVADDKIVPEAQLCDDFGADSLDAVEIAMSLEAEFGIEWIDDGEMSKVVTVADLMDLTERAIKAEARKPAPEKRPPQEGRKVWFPLWW